MKIAKSVIELAVKHKVTVSRNWQGVYVIGIGKRARFAQTAKGAIRQINWFIEEDKKLHTMFESWGPVHSICGIKTNA